MKNKLHVKKGDSVIVLSGTEKGKIGKVAEAFPKRGLVLVEGIGMRKKHQKPRKAGQHGQIINKHLPLQASKVMEVGRHKEKMARKKQ
ncbi:50S ribosomal protein L24 [Candidatus Adlerbacteria bacterium RIFCSPLOWO2_01_FULL_51_16]|uniref:Large ribosomal subunit protein uL24 n=1 Tax=Candidatus Adlerbacteria bacterium RIFCSPLOWO2_01_FULL_51_16 TaxID=1797243 RepID=A0A1F4XJE7_9BACT|nr:MAG: 50S ribosomal protein L24 [Candidatus Adlerbacteria bacterium RIFCSPLOWO2_01_FULL_51_16]